MELATTQSVLMQIQPTIQRFARMLASVLQLEVEIVDENLCRVAGTGAYGKFLGRQLSGNSRLLRHVPKRKLKKLLHSLASIPFAKVAIVKKIAAKSISGYACHFTGSLCWGDKFDCRYPRATRAYQ